MLLFISLFSVLFHFFRYAFISFLFAFCPFFLFFVSSRFWFYFISTVFSVPECFPQANFNLLKQRFHSPLFDKKKKKNIAYLIKNSPFCQFYSMREDLHQTCHVFQGFCYEVFVLAVTSKKKYKHSQSKTRENVTCVPIGL